MHKELQAKTLELAKKYRHDRVTEHHVLLAWLMSNTALEFAGKDVARANTQLDVRDLPDKGLVEKSNDPAISITETGRLWLQRAMKEYDNVESIQELIAVLKIRTDDVPDIGDVVPNKSKPKASTAVKSKAAKAAAADEGQTILNEALAELDALIGQESVKARVQTLIHQQKVNKALRDQGGTPPTAGLNLIFAGSPGTGKTTVARILARIYKGLGLLDSGHLVETSQVDLIGQYVGHTGQKTQEKIDEALNGILFIDEAYSLVDQHDRQSYGKEAINVLVANMDNHQSDLAVIAAGYTVPMLNFVKSNPGLQSRFTTTLHFEDYTARELTLILGKMAEDHGIKLTDEVAHLVNRHFQRNVTTGANGNGRYARKLFLRMFEMMSIRAMEDGVIEPHEIEAFWPEDVPANLESTGKTRDIDAVMAELNGLVGLTAVKEKINNLINLAKARKVADDAGLPMVEFNLNLVFAGDPGTGKTTVARLVAEAYQALGVLPRGHLVETGRGDLVAEFVGQTAIKTQGKIDEASGGVLFIDEAYSLIDGGNGHSYGQEALTTLVQEMENHRGEFAVIVAGYKDEMKFFVEANPGLKSRFDEHIFFPNFTKEELLSMFLTIAESKQITVSPEVKTAIANHLNNNSTGGSDGNGRYIRKLFDRMHESLVGRAAKADFDLTVMTAFDPSDVPAKLHEGGAPTIGFN